MGTTTTQQPHAQAKQVSWQVADVEREQLDVDVLIVGAGPAGLATAIHLRRLLVERGMGDKTVLVLEKAEEVGYHVLSGAVMDPRGMAELFPDWLEKGCPVENSKKRGSFADTRRNPLRSDGVQVNVTASERADDGPASTAATVCRPVWLGANRAFHPAGPAG